MSESPEELQRRIAELEAQLRALKAAQASPSRTSGPQLNQPVRSARDTYIATNQTVNVLGPLIYGPDPSAEQREQLVRYLQRLAAKLQRLSLRGLAARLDDGQGIALPKVYVMLAIAGQLVGVINSEEPGFEDFYVSDGQALKQEFDPDWALPSKAVIEFDVAGHSTTAYHLVGKPRTELLRAQLVAEAVFENQYLVLLGDPGDGKSTFLRHLAWALARRGLDQLTDDTHLFGWEDQARLLPALLPLRKLAGRIAAEGVNPETVSAALRDELTREYDVRQADTLLDRALAGGVALLLFDGLDEVPLVAVPGVADRLTTVRAIRDFAELHGNARVVLTCRTRAFDEQLRRCLGWPVETIAPFTLGQIRHFVADWYDALTLRGSITRDLGEAQARDLIAAIVGSRRLLAMATNPLLLTMMALVLYEKGELPRDRPLLYERILEQLLGQWDQQKGGQSLAEVIGDTNLRGDDLRRTLDELSYNAHATVTSSDGRGRLAAKELRYALAGFFETVHVDGAWEAAGRCLAYFHERSGLLVPEDDGESYAFAHLTLQEHGAGRHMLLHPKAVELVMRYRAEDRWREPIALGLGVVQKLHPPLADRIDRVLTELIDPDEGTAPKPRERWYRDLVLAAELGNERDWNLLRALINVDRIQRDLRRGLVALLGDKDQPLPVAERVRAGFLLGDLGDPRFPVTIEDWRRELARTERGDIGGYFCRIEAGTYIIGSADDDPDARDEEKPQYRVTFDRPFWIARYPVTNAQWRAWVQAGGEPSAYDDDDDLNHANQPVVGVMWYSCNKFCRWLSDQLGVAVRLPAEAEWEAAARGGDARRYPWSDEWHDDRAATAEDRNIRGRRWTMPVGCYSAGAASCGAYDLAGNVWEWTSDSGRSYPGAKKPFADNDMRVLRGGGFNDSRTYVRCGARISSHAVIDGNSYGFRVLLAPRLAE